MALIQRNTPLNRLTPNANSSNFIVTDKKRIVDPAGHLLTIGTDGANDRGFLSGSYGDMQPPTAGDADTQIYALVVTLGGNSIVQFGALGNEQLDGALALRITIWGFPGDDLIVTWNDTNNRYEGQDPGLFLWMDDNLGGRFAVSATLIEAHAFTMTVGNAGDFYGFGLGIDGAMNPDSYKSSTFWDCYTTTGDAFKLAFTGGLPFPGASQFKIQIPGASTEIFDLDLSGSEYLGTVTGSLAYLTAQLGNDVLVHLLDIQD